MISVESRELVVSVDAFSAVRCSSLEKGGDYQEEEDYQLLQVVSQSSSLQ